MTIVLDTSIVIDLLRGDPRAETVIDRAVELNEMIAASVLTKVEVLAGMFAAEEADTRELLATFNWVEVDDELAELAGAYANRYLRSHPGVDPVDFVIAATTERLNASLWTLNVRHFPMFPELTAPY